MKTKGFCIIRTRKGSTVGLKTIVTHDFIGKDHHYKFKDAYLCDSFEILENVGGSLIVKLYTKMKYSGVGIENTLKFEKGIVTEIEIEDCIEQ